MLIRDPMPTATERAFLAAARRAVLATIAPDGRPRLVPICFVLDEHRPILYTPIDEKPKIVHAPARLARIRDILTNPSVSLLVDRWDEDWARLAWLRCHGTASLLEPGDGAAERATTVTALRRKYSQYASHRLETRPIIRIAIERISSWGDLGLP